MISCCDSNFLLSKKMFSGSSEDTVSFDPKGQICHHWPISEIQLATQDFDERLIIGKGGFGKVYKGKMKIGPKTVAIKRLDSGSAQGATEFWAEVETLSMLRHCNLVSLIGYCNDNKEMILVYDYMPNGTLEDHLHKLHTTLSFSHRLKICIGAARGLQYLHTGTHIEKGIIHRDVKSSNILLDNNWVAKISDFGLSKISPINKPSTGVDTLIKGTFGYIDPNYFSTGRLTRKSDVFSLGVILLEVLCRKQAVDSSLDEEQWSLVEWAQDFIRRGKLTEIIDKYLKGEISSKCLSGYAKIVDSCLHNNPTQRITMAEVVSGLESILALHEKSDNSTLNMGLFTCCRKFLKSFLPTEEKSATTSKESNNLNLFQYQHRRRQYVGLQNRSSTKLAHGELETVGWPSWLDAVNGEALKGWLPRKADTFEKLDKIGDSNVYKARDMHTGNFVMLKKIHYYPSDPERVKRMTTEIEILRCLDHPNVIKLVGIVTARISQSLYMVFEYMDHDLAALSKIRATRFTESEVKHYTRQLLWGLKYCHDHRVLHRDLKLSDLLVDNNGVLKIAGFGSASFFDLIHEQPITKHVAATYWYTAPELLIGATIYTAGVDLWSAGCILAELLAKRPVMAGHTKAEQLEKIYALCGSPSDEYWKRYKLPGEIRHQPILQSSLRDRFKDFPPASLSLLDVLLSIDPDKRQDAASALKSKFLSMIS